MRARTTKREKLKSQKTPQHLTTAAFTPNLIESMLKGYKNKLI